MISKFNMNTCLLLIRWRCLHCRKCISIREGSFFVKSKLTLQKWLILMYWWVREYAVGDASEEAKVTANSAVQVYQCMRDNCSTKLKQHPIKLGGPGVAVQIDESLYRHKPKNHRGRGTQNEVWVFGLVDTSHMPALGYMQIVPQRDAATLLPIVQAHTLRTLYYIPMSGQHTGEWPACRMLPSMTQLTTQWNLSTAPLGHTQNVESYWNKTKIKFKRMKGCHASMLPSHLDEFRWRERFGKTATEAFNRIMRDIADQYPV